MFLIFYFVFMAKCVVLYCALENEGTFLQLKPFQAGDCVQVLECRGERKNLILIKIALVKTNDTLAVYMDKENECKTSYLFSACVVSKDSAIVKVLVIPSEEKTRQFVCYVRSTVPEGDIRSKEHYINVTNNNVSSTSITSTGTSAMGITTVSPDTNMKILLTGIDAGVFAGVLVLLILVMVATTGLLYFYSKKRFQTNFGSEQRSIISDDGENKNQCVGAITYRAKQVPTRGLTMPTRPSVFSTAPPTSLAPEVPGNSSVMRYHKSLDRGSKTLSALTDKFKSPSDNYDVISFRNGVRCPVIESGISSYTDAFSSGAKFTDDNSTISSARLSPAWRESRDDFGISMERKLCKPQPQSSLMISPRGDGMSRMDSEPASKYQVPWEFP